MKPSPAAAFHTYLITGGAGNLARQLAPQLVNEGGQVVLYDIAEQPTDFQTGQMIYVQGDLTRPDEIDALLARHKPDVVLHMASLLSGRCEEDRLLGWKVNVEACVTLFEAALRHRVKTFFFPSSLAAYGGVLPDPLPEDHAQWPRGIYGVSKATCERLGNYYHHHHGLDFRCLRLPVVISRFAPPGAASAYASRAFVECVESGHFTFKVNPTTCVSTVYVKDVLIAIKQLIQAQSQKLTRRAYNIDALSPSAQDIADVLQRHVPTAQMRFEPDPMIANLIESWPRVMVDRSARRDWQWSPQFDLETMAQDFIEQIKGDGSHYVPASKQ